MPALTTRILREDWETSPRLVELQLEKSKLLTVRSTAVGAAADATPFHPANAAGTFSYQHGTFALRHEHVFAGSPWTVERPNGVEAIRNESNRTKLVFANVDIACNDEHQPKPRSRKGAGAERLCVGNSLFGDLPHYVPHVPVHDGWTIYYLMVAPNGAVELSCPVVEGGTFVSFIERLYLSDGSDLDGEFKLSLDDHDAAHFDPKVARK